MILSSCVKLNFSSCKSWTWNISLNLRSQMSFSDWIAPKNDCCSHYRNIISQFLIKRSKSISAKHVPRKRDETFISMSQKAFFSFASSGKMRSIFHLQHTPKSQKKNLSFHVFSFSTSRMLFYMPQTIVPGLHLAIFYIFPFSTILFRNMPQFFFCRSLELPSCIYVRHYRWLNETS